MDQVTQQNAALVEEAAAAAESMQEQAQALAHAVSVFKLMQNTNAGMQAPAQSSVPSEPNEKKASARIERLPVKKNFAANTERAVALPKAVGAENEWSEF